MKKALILIAIFVIVQVVVSSVTVICMQAVGEPMGISKEQQGWSVGISLFLSNLLMIGLTYVVLYKQGEKNPFASYGKFPSGKLLVLTLIGLFLAVFPINALIEIADVPDFIKSLIGDMIKNPLCVFTVCVLGPVAEEVVFRRGILGSLLETKRFSKYALILSALFFSLIHGNPTQMIGAFVLGLFFGWLYLKTHSIVLPIICHIINNSVSVILALSYGEESKIQDIFPSPTTYYISIVLSAILFAGIYKPLSQALNKESNIL